MLPAVTAEGGVRETDLGEGMMNSLHVLSDRGREGFWPPLPPNRTGGFPAYGSPVGGFSIETVSLLARSHKGEQPGIREGGIPAICDAVASTDSTRSVHTSASTDA